MVAWLVRPRLNSNEIKLHQFFGSAEKKETKRRGGRHSHRSRLRERERERIRALREENERRREGTMITRSNLAEQLREYQIRSKHDWASVSFFSSTSSNLASSRVDVVVFVIWELVILAFLVFSVVSLYFKHIRLAFILVCITVLLLLCMKITKQVRLARRKKRRMLLPLSM
ncbi:uncharacterized protein LOC107460219 [Arachis duranensis]|uniref:Uncharacterized protein LOC107460219 n=2 Tax=Arachis TaxID=3817 RepID=A0A6P4B927_ARADU|nr:uncharacterized protein LOC107460219 [Arachis duranensis]